MLIKDKEGKYGHKGKWILISKSRPKRVLRIYGNKKPSESKVKEDERQIEYFKHKMRFLE
jgi:hypothetical protein